MATQTTTPLKTARPSAGALAEQRHQLFDPAVPPLACPAPRTTAHAGRQVAA